MFTNQLPAIKLINFTQLSKAELCTILKWRNHSSVRKWSLSRAKISHQRHFQFVQQLKLNPTNQFWLATRNDEAIGVSSLTTITHNQGTIGIYINPDLQHQGLGTELLAFFLQHLTRQYPRLRLKITVFAQNIPAVKLYQKFGFHQAALQKIPRRGVILSMNREGQKR